MIKLDEIKKFDYDGSAETKIEIRELFRRIIKGISVNSNYNNVRYSNIMGDTFYIRFNKLILKFELTHLNLEKYNSFKTMYEIEDKRIKIYDGFKLTMINQTSILDTKKVKFNDIFGRTLPCVRIEYDKYDHTKDEIYFKKYKAISDHTDCVIFEYPLYEEIKLTYDTSEYEMNVLKNDTDKVLSEKFYMSFNSGALMLSFDSTVNKIVDYICNYIMIFNDKKGLYNYYE